MADLSPTVLLATPLVEAIRVSCCAPRSGCGDEEWDAVPQVVIPRRGVYVVHRRDDTVLADATTAVVFGADETYRVSHPLDGGDESTALVFRPELHAEALGSVRGHSGRLTPGTQVAAWLFAAGVLRGRADGFEAEEAALLLLDAVASDIRGRAQPGVDPRRRTQRDRVDRVRVLLAGDISRRWRLDTVAAAVHCSPFHLARQFRQATGETMSRHLLRLRLAAALDRLAEGERDLARLAADLGFAGHSHFTSRFRSVLGRTPSAMRDAAGRGELGEVRRIVTAERTRTT